ncbi:MAG: hypothetical protein Q8L80_03435 [Gallionella sp.]|nr:hypothetical protein [Gallionella sp.]MDP1941550.1 hypothetical protein [Gallionella sp.]
MREIAPASLGEIPEEEFVKPPGMTQNALTELLNKIQPLERMLRDD